MNAQNELQTACTHPDRELLGWDRSLAFGRCLACGSILLKQNGTLWSVRRRDEAANDDEEDRPLAVRR